MMKKSTTIMLAVLLMITMVLAACSNEGNNTATNNAPTNKPAENDVKEPEAPASNEPTELIVASDQEPVGFDPHKVPAISSKRVYTLIYETLTKMDTEMKVVPSLAKEWTVAPDGKKVTFILQEGVKFHNGREMTSDDVKFSFDRIMNTETGALATSYFSSVESIEVPDAKTVIFNLKNVDSALIANVASPYTSIVPKEVTDLNTEMVGTGPFKVIKVENDAIALEKFADYYAPELPKSDKITFRIMKEEAERLAAIRTGAIHLTTVSADSATLLGNNDDVSIESYQSMEYGYLGINVNKEPFNDVRVRQAMSYAIDREAIVGTVWKGEGQITGPISPAQELYAIDVTGVDSYKRDIAKAKELLKEAGFENGFETVLQTASTYPDMLESAQILQQQLKEIGIIAKIEQLEWAKYIETWKSKEDKTLLVGRNTAGTDPDRSLRFFFSTTGGANVWNYTNPAFDTLVQQALETNELEQRQKLYNEAQQLLLVDNPNLFLASPKYFYAVNKNVEGFVPSAAEEAYSLIRTSVKQ